MITNTIFTNQPKILPMLGMSMILWACGTQESSSVQENVFGEKDDVKTVLYNNPDITADLGVGLWAWPLPMDYDGDGDIDMVVSCPDKPFNGTYLFENTQPGEEYPVFEPPVRIGKGTKNIQVSYIDGEPRVMLPGVELVNFKSGNPEEVVIFSMDEIHSELPKKPRFDQCTYVDYDGDGDADIIVGVDNWFDYGWDNAFNDEGVWTNGPLHGYVYWLENKDGEYIHRGRIQVEGKDLDVYGAPSPNFADFDGDGDLDLICGEFVDKLTYFENVGSRTNPEYKPGQFLTNASGIIKMDLEMIIPVALDWNGDGNVDLIVGDEDGRVAYIKHTGKYDNGMPIFEDPFYFQQKTDRVKFGALATPYGIDWDNDGDEDIITGNSAGYIAFIENLDGQYPPKWSNPQYLTAEGEVIRIQAGDNGSIQGPCEAKWGYTTLSVADWDMDGLQDIIVNSIWGKILWYKNIGTEKEPKLAAAQPVTIDWMGEEAKKAAWNWWTPEEYEFTTQWRTTPYAIDWNEDGMTDLVMLDHEGYLAFFERFKAASGDLYLKPGQRIFYGSDISKYDSKNRVIDSIPGLLQLNVREFGGSGRVKLAFVDWDGDGAKDLLVNSENITWLKNVKQEGEKVYFENQGPMADAILAGHTTSPTIVDWNRDEIPDLFIGAEDGHFYYLENQRSK